VGLYGAAAAAAFGACVVVMGLVYRRILRPGLRQPEVEARRRALARWVGAVVGFQLLLGVAVVVYLVVTARSHTPALGRALPPLGAVLGNALALQFALARLARALRS
jgi:drug/metabolite transporter (DMT)-like permease